MSQNDSLDFTDPLGVWRSFRDANLDAWAKGLTSMVGTDAFAKAIGMQLDTYLAASAPFQKAVEQYMEAYLAQLHMPTRGEVVSLAQRMTSIEMRLDDMDARLDEILEAVGVGTPVAAPVVGTVVDEKLSALESRTDQVIDLLQRLAAGQDDASDTENGKPAARPRRNRPAAKSEEE